MHVRPAHVRDLPDLATIARHAMFDDEVTEFLAPYRHQHPECLRLGILRRVKKRFYDGHLVLAAVSDDHDPWWDGQEKVVGYLSAISSRQEEEHQKASRFSWGALELRLLRLEELIEWYTFADRSLSRSAYLQFLNNISGRGPLADIKEYWDIDHLSVSPAHQGKGVGKALVRYVQKVAAKNKLPVVLVASNSGYPMYKKLGFVDKGAFAMAAGCLNEAMVWYPPDVATGMAISSSLPAGGQKLRFDVGLQQIANPVSSTQRQSMVHSHLTTRNCEIFHRANRAPVEREHDPQIMVPGMAIAQTIPERTPAWHEDIQMLVCSLLADRWLVPKFTFDQHLFPCGSNHDITANGLRLSNETKDPLQNAQLHLPGETGNTMSTNALFGQ